MPAVPPVGTNGWAIALGLNAVFLRQGIPLRASWGVSRDRLWTGWESCWTGTCR